MPVAKTHYDRMTVLVPHTERRRFRAVSKALGYIVEKETGMDKAIADIEAGRIHQYSSLEELIKKLS